MKSPQEEEWNTGEEYITGVQQLPIFLTESEHTPSKRRTVSAGLQDFRSEMMIARTIEGHLTHRDEVQMKIMQQDSVEAAVAQNKRVLRQEKCKDEERNSPRKQTKRLAQISRFIGKMKRFSSFLRFQQVSKRQLEIINDSSFNFAFFFSKGFFQNEKPTYSDKMNFFLDRIGFWKMLRLDGYDDLVIMPDSLQSRTWDIIQFICLSMYIAYLPIRLAFSNLHFNSTLFLFMEVIPNISQLINVFYEVNKGFYKKGTVILDRKEIILRYISTRFIYDLILIVFWLLSLNSYASLWWKTIGMFRMIHFFQILRKIEDATDVREYFGSYFDLCQLSGVIMICAHFTGCCWYALSRYQLDIGITTTWLSDDLSHFDVGIDNPILRGYVASVYWSIITMCTVGYGDISPKTYRERIFVLFICLLASFLFAFSMNSIGEIIRTIRQRDEVYKESVAALNIYMKKRLLDGHLQLRVRRYYEYLSSSIKTKSERSSQLLESLAPSLREEIFKDIYTNMFRKQKLFRDNFSADFIAHLFRVVKEKKYDIDEFIFKQGEASTKLYLILDGEVDIRLKDGKVVRSVGQDQLIGSVEFFGNQPHMLSAQASAFTQAAVIEKDEFLQLLFQFPQQYQSFCQLKDNASLEQNVASLVQNCESCGATTHRFKNCDQINFRMLKKQEILKFNASKQLTRTVWDRRDSTCHARSCAHQIHESVVSFIEFTVHEDALKRDDLVKKCNLADEESDIEKSVDNESQCSRTIAADGVRQQPRIIKSNFSKHVTRMYEESDELNELLSNEEQKIFSNQSIPSEQQQAQLKNYAMRNLLSSKYSFNKLGVFGARHKHSQIRLLDELSPQYYGEGIKSNFLTLDEKRSLFKNTYSIIEGQSLKQPLKRNPAQQNLFSKKEEEHTKRKQQFIPIHKNSFYITVVEGEQDDIFVQSQAVEQEIVHSESVALPRLNVNSVLEENLNLNKNLIVEMCRMASLKEDHLLRPANYETVEVDFDKVNNFAVYFVHNNVSVVVSALNQLLMRNHAYKNMLKAKDKNMSVKIPMQRVHQLESQKLKKSSYNHLIHRKIPSLQKHYNFKKIIVDTTNSQELQSRVYAQQSPERDEETPRS